MANEFPTPFYSGPPYVHYSKHRKDYGEVTVSSEFEDGGVDLLMHAADAPQRWTLIYQGLTQTQRKTIIDHWNTNKLTGLFTFKEPRDEPWTGTTGTTYTNLVQYESAPEEPQHSKVWSQSLTVHLIMRPA